MAKNTKQVALIQHRQGLKSELSKRLHTGEIGLALDTNEIFMGNPNNPVLQERLNADEPVFPYGNIQILTEFTDNINKIEYSFTDDVNSVNYPIIISGTEFYPQIPNGSSIIINDEEIKLEKDNGENFLTLNEVIDLINQANISTKASNTNGLLTLTSTDKTLTVENGKMVGESGVLEIVGLPTTTNNANNPSTRPLQEVLNDRTSIKNFDVYGDGSTNDADNIYNAIIALYGYGKPQKLTKELFFPAGEYIVNNKSLLLITNTYLKGEGQNRTILKVIEGTEPLLITGDDNYIPATDDNYCIGLTGIFNEKYPHNITIEDMTINTSESSISNVVYLGSSSRVTFRNVEFNGADLSSIIKTANESKISELLIENCRFRSLGDSRTFLANAVVINGGLYHFNIINNKFTHINNEAILFNNSEDDEVYQRYGIISNNYFEDSGRENKNVLYLGNKTSFINVVDNVFDKEILDGTDGITPYISNNNLNYVEIFEEKTDDRKILKYRFNNPEWAYLDYFINPNGEYLIKSNYERNVSGEINNLTNGLEINQGDISNNDTFKIKTTLAEGSLELDVGKYGSLSLGNQNDEYSEWEAGINYEIGDKVQWSYDDSGNKLTDIFYIYKCNVSNTSTNENSPKGIDSAWDLVGEYKPVINIHKSIDLQGNYISNDTTKSDITFKVDSNIVKVDDKNNSIPYEYRIAPNDDALTNVAYVNRVSNPTIREKLDFANLEDKGTSKIDLIEFDPILYGDFVYLKKASFNVRRPFYPLRKYINDTMAIEWKTGYKWYAGEVIKYTDNSGYKGYYACTKDHTSTNWEDDLENLLLWEEVFTTGKNFETGLSEQLNDVKYVTLYAYKYIEDGKEEPARFLFPLNQIDIQRRDLNGNYYKEIQYNTAYRKNDIVLKNDRYWKCVANNTPANIYDLHNTSKWIMIQESGYNYIFDFERSILIENSETGVIAPDTEKDYILEYNFSGYKLELRLYDENGLLLPVIKSDYDDYNAEYDDSGNKIDVEGDVKKHIQINPSGSMLLSVDYMRGNG